MTKQEVKREINQTNIKLNTVRRCNKTARLYKHLDNMKSLLSESFPCSICGELYGTAEEAKSCSFCHED